MKRLVVMLGLLGIGIGSASGCADDNRPVVGIEPQGNAGEMSQGGEPVAGGGSSHAGTSSAGSLNRGGNISGGGTTPNSSGADTGGVSLGGQSAGGQAPETGGAGGAVASEQPPFAAPYAVVYAAPIEGVDTRFPKVAAWEDGALARWTSELDEMHDIGSARNLDTGLDGVVQWGRWANGTLTANDGLTLNAKQGFHYAIGSLTPTLPVNGTQEYVVSGATAVTVGDGSVDVGVATAAATAAFGATTKLGVAIGLTIGNVAYALASTGGVATPATSEVTAWDAAHPARLGGVPPKPTTGICTDGCAVSVQGFFAGANAAQLALVVHIFDVAGGSPTSISAVIVMKKKP